MIQNQICMTLAIYTSNNNIQKTRVVSCNVAFFYSSKGYNVKFNLFYVFCVQYLLSLFGRKFSIFNGMNQNVNEYRFKQKIAKLID